MSADSQTPTEVLEQQRYVMLAGLVLFETFGVGRSRDQHQCLAAINAELQRRQKDETQ